MSKVAHDYNTIKQDTLSITSDIPAVKSVMIYHE